MRAALWLGEQEARVVTEHEERLRLFGSHGTFFAISPPARSPWRAPLLPVGGVLVGHVAKRRARAELVAS